MRKNKTSGDRRFPSLKRLVEHFDRHDLGDLWEDLPEVRFDIRLKKRTRLIAIDGRLADRISTLARSRRTSTGRLVRSWLREKIRKLA